VVVVSRDAINQSMHAVVCLITGNPRERSLPSCVTLGRSDDTGLSYDECWIQAHEVLTLDAEAFLGDAVGELPIGKLIELEARLRYTLDIETDADVAARRSVP
jgi:mRNA-degrading endonuclease toxin of MazEF toxin-antitoxin module